MKLLWTVEARQDRRDTREHIAKDNLAAAVTLDEMFTRKARNLEAVMDLRFGMIHLFTDEHLPQAVSV